tara:strand:- start:3 stop:224 length:222 start_codon:yes stop_codon:yes gene_type:complete
MSWEYTIKKRAYQSRSPKMFPESEKCVVKVCDATSCRHNSIHTGKEEITKCTLPQITINSDGICNQFEKELKA